MRQLRLPVSYKRTLCSSWTPIIWVTLSCSPIFPVSLQVPTCSKPGQQNETHLMQPCPRMESGLGFPPWKNSVWKLSASPAAGGGSFPPVQTGTKRLSQCPAPPGHQLSGTSLAGLFWGLSPPWRFLEFCCLDLPLSPHRLQVSRVFSSSGCSGGWFYRDQVPLAGPQKPGCWGSLVKSQILVLGHPHDQPAATLLLETTGFVHCSSRGQG